MKNVDILCASACRPTPCLHDIALLSYMWDIPRSKDMATATLTYDAKIDSKKRVTLRGAKYEYYNVQEMDDGSVVLSPRVLVSPFEISANTLETMDQSMENLKTGKVSKPIKL